VLLGSGWFTAWEAFLEHVAPCLPGGVATQDTRERLAAGVPIIHADHEKMPYMDEFDQSDLPRLARALGVPVGPGNGTTVDPAPYFPPRPPGSNNDIAAALDVEPAPKHLRHTALGDADWVMPGLRQDDGVGARGDARVQVAARRRLIRCGASTAGHQTNRYG
jgi:hypothetical protein